MRGAIEFEYDVARDVVIATPHWRIETEDDVRAWYAQYEAYFEPLVRRVDVVFVLDHFDLRPALGVLWGEYRARMQQCNTRYSIRVHPSLGVKLYVRTSGNRHGAMTDEAPDLESAYARLEELRSRGGSGA